MHTGYDNFWMYQNSRHEPVLNLQKNDNYVCPVLTDNYKQMQNGGYPSNNATSLNNTVNPCQNGQCSTDPQCMWPSSVYSLPPYANDFCSQMFSVQNNNFNYASQTSWSKNGVRYSNAPQKIRGNNQEHGTKLPQYTNYTDTETARIRVKDVFTLNNTAIYDPVLGNSLAQTQKNKQHKYPLKYSTNNCSRTCDFETNLPVAKHLPSFYLQTKQSCVSNQQQFPHYSDTLYHQKAQLPSQSQFHSNGSRQKRSILQSKGFKTKPSLVRQLLSCHNQKKNQEDQNKLCNEPNGNKRITFEPNRMNQLSYLKNLKSHINPETTNIINFNDSSEINEDLACNNLNSNNFVCVQNQDQVNFPDPDQIPSLNQISSVKDLRKRQINEPIISSNAKCFPNNQISGLENNLVKITIPHTGQCTYLNPSDPSIIEGNSSVSLSTSLDSNNEIFHDVLNKKNLKNYIQDNGSNNFSVPQTDQVRPKSCNTSLGGNLVYNTPELNPNDCNSAPSNSDNTYYKNVTSPRNASTQGFPQEPHDKLKQKALRNSRNFLKSTRENFNSGIYEGNKNMNEFIVGLREAEFISQTEADLNEITIKKEINNLAVVNSTMQLDENIAIDQVLDKIKAEDHSDDFEVNEQEQELRSSENISLVEESIPSNSVDRGDIAFNKVETHIVDSKRIGPKPITQKTNESKHSENENCTPELEISQNLVRKKECTGNNVAQQEEKLEKANSPIKEGNYKCKINRDKLDLLIEFLKKDDEMVESKTSKEKDQPIGVKKITDCNKRKKEINLTSSRRKLSKTCIVKNKNNSREMVSLVSHKISRTEIQDSPKRPQAVNLDGNSKKEEEKQNSCLYNVKAIEKPFTVSANKMKSYNSFEENEKQNDLDSKFEPKIKYTSIGCQTQENLIEEEKNIMNIMQALQNLKSHFCLSCTLASPIESFWINVVSSELRCLNCFKKMSSKTDENILKLRRTSIDSCNSAEPKPLLDEKMQNLNENKNPKFETTCSRSKYECASDKLNYSKVNIKQEMGEALNESMENKIAYMNNEERNFASKDKKAEKKNAIRTLNLPRKKSIEDQKKLKIGESEEKFEKTNIKDFTLKTNVLDDNSKLEIKPKKKLSVKEDFVLDKIQKAEEKASAVKSRRKSNSEETEVPINTFTVNYSKELSDSSAKKIISKEEIESTKAKAHCGDNLKKEEKQPSQSVVKFTSKEQYTFLKSKISKECAEQETRGDSDRAIKINLFKEEEVGKKDKKQSKDSNYNRKGENSKEEFDSSKVHFSEEEIMSAFDVKSPLNESFDFYKLHSAEVILKRNTICTDQKAKMSSNKKNTNPSEDSEGIYKPIYKNSEKDKSMESMDQSRKRKKSVEELIPYKIRITEEHSKDIKFAKQYSEKSKSSFKADDVNFKSKTSEHSKHFVCDLKSVPQKKIKDECLSLKEQLKSDMKKYTESSDKMKRNSTSKENHSTPEHSKKEVNFKKKLILPNKEKERKHFFEKIPERSGKNSEKNGLGGIKFSFNDDKNHKLGMPSKPLKESQCQRIESEMKISSPVRLFKKQELHENGSRQKEQSDGKITEKKINEKQTIDDGNKFEKKKNLEHKISKKQRCDKGQTENTGKFEKGFIKQSKKNKALERMFGKKRKEDLREFQTVCIEKPTSAKLLEKLIEKTKKLSWTLLGET